MSESVYQVGSVKRCDKCSEDRDGGRSYRGGISDTKQQPWQQRLRPSQFQPTESRVSLPCHFRKSSFVLLKLSERNRNFRSSSVLHPHIWNGKRFHQLQMGKKDLSQMSVKTQFILTSLLFQVIVLRTNYYMKRTFD